MEYIENISLSNLDNILKAKQMDYADLYNAIGMTRQQWGHYASKGSISTKFLDAISKVLQVDINTILYGTQVESQGNGAMISIKGHKDTTSEVFYLRLPKEIFKSDTDFDNLKAILVSSDELAPKVMPNDYIIFEETNKYTSAGLYALKVNDEYIIQDISVNKLNGKATITILDEKQEIDFNDIKDKILGKKVLQLSF